jgi:uncharacterized protein (DUF1330 family)
MAAYYVSQVIEVTDPEGLGSYQQQANPLIERLGGRIIAFDPTPTALEGEWQPAPMVIIAFDSMEQLRNWYEHEEYQPLKALRLRSIVCNSVAIEGF